MGRSTTLGAMLMAAAMLGACNAAPAAPAAPAARPLASPAASMSAAQVLQVLQAAGLCRDPEPMAAQISTETQFGHPAMTTCHEPGSAIEDAITIIDGVQPIHRDRMARQLAQLDIRAYVHDEHDHWLLEVPAAREAGIEAAFGDQLKRLPVRP